MREAQRGEFPKLIPFHAGPRAMFAVSMRKGQEGWVKCTWCRKWLSGPTCRHCFSSNHIYQAKQALIDWA
eukprot:2216557-Lingulodinium_polyedra.AAC.1